MKQSLVSLVSSFGNQRLLIAAGVGFLSGAVFAALLKFNGTAALMGALALVCLSVGVLPSEYRSRVLLAFALAPLVPAIAAMIQSGQTRPSAVVVLYAYYFSMLNVPVYLLILRRHRWLGVWQVLAAGVAMGALAGFFFSRSTLVFTRGFF